MFKRACAFLVFALCLAAAPWDGQRGPFTLYTVAFHANATPALGFLPGYVPGISKDSMGISVLCADSTITAARLTVTYKDEDGSEKEVILVANLYPIAWDRNVGWGGVMTDVPESRILRVKLTALRDGEVYQ
jgi:hypothetical protein